jgi:mono/diheme cytochrome c family protein
VSEISSFRQKRFQNGMATVSGFILAGIIAAGGAGCGSAPAPQTGSAAGTAPSNASSTAAPMAGAMAATAATPEAKGKQFFEQSCSNCHGMNGQGVPHLGADLQTSKFVAKATDGQLVSLIEHGIPANDPRNTSHIPMPPKGANPSLTTQDIQQIVLYIRQLQKEGARAK